MRPSVLVCVRAHRKLWVSKVLPEIINLFLIFSGEMMKKELSRQKLFISFKKVVQKSDT